MSTPGNQPWPKTNPIVSQYNNWSNDSKLLSDITDWYKQEIAQIIELLKEHKAGSAFWLFQTQGLSLLTQHGEASLKVEADALGISSSIQNQITNCQNAFNNLINNIENNGSFQSGEALASALSKQLSALEQDLGLHGMNNIFGSTNLKNLVGYVEGIKSNLHDAPPGYSYEPLLYYAMYGCYRVATNNGQPVPEQFNQISSSFSGATQSVSGLSSSIQAQIQYLNQNLQQYFGIYKSFFDDYSNLSSYIVSHTNSN
jgi:hypothetical protein